MSEAYKWQLFIMGFIWGVLTIKVLPLIFKDAWRTLKYILSQIKKRSTADTAERDENRISNYSITNQQNNFHNQNFERWE